MGTRTPAGCGTFKGRSPFREGGGQERFEYTVWGLALGVSQVWVSVLGV